MVLGRVARRRRRDPAGGAAVPLAALPDRQARRPRHRRVLLAQRLRGVPQQDQALVVHRTERATLALKAQLRQAAAVPCTRRTILEP